MRNIVILAINFLILLAGLFSINFLLFEFVFPEEIKFKIIMFFISSIIILLFALFYKTEFINKAHDKKNIINIKVSSIFRSLHLFFCILWLPYLFFCYIAGIVPHNEFFYQLNLFVAFMYFPLAFFVIFFSRSLEKTNQLKKAYIALMIPFLILFLSIVFLSLT